MIFVIYSLKNHTKFNSSKLKTVQNQTVKPQSPLGLVRLYLQNFLQKFVKTDRTGT
ncbi:hypothetical protein Hanom_Chr14g01261521 [Helianthus anomalus]